MQKEFDRVNKAFNSASQRLNDKFLLSGGPPPDQEEEMEVSALRTWKLDVLKRITANNKRKRTLEETSDRLLNEGPKKQVIAFYQQVGMFDDKDGAPRDIVESTTASSNTLSVLTDDRDTDLFSGTTAQADKDDTDKSDEDDDDE